MSRLMDKTNSWLWASKSPTKMHRPLKAENIGGGGRRHRCADYLLVLFDLWECLHLHRWAGRWVLHLPHPGEGETEKSGGRRMISATSKPICPNSPIPNWKRSTTMIAVLCVCRVSGEGGGEENSLRPCVSFGVHRPLVLVELDISRVLGQSPREHPPLSEGSGGK